MVLDAHVLARLGNPRRVLVAGCGGGYDVLGAVPIRHELVAGGIAVELASLSFAYLNGLDGAGQDRDIPNLYAVGGAAATERAYCPEAWLARWLGDDHVVWCFDKTGVRPLARAYRALVDRLAIDAIVLVDGGIDAVLRGDETSLGTPSEDLASLAAATGLGIPVALACVGMTAELRDGIAHAQVLERFAELARASAWLGASALVAGTPACDAYLRALTAVRAGQRAQKGSHVHDVISRALDGEFGAVAPHVWLSPLATMYWWLDAREVARTHLFLDDLRATDSIWEVAARVEAARKQLAVRERAPIPI
ncbi:MAG TPA: DUF1152 domain-containing protein [Kofleriaceae bacterium]|nr:DUF1152 domain-containing protein [Kofleriaceae bacterium]